MRCMVKLKITSIGLLASLAFCVEAQYRDFTKILEVITPPQSQTAIEVWDLQNDHQILSKNSQQMFIPASTQKLLTAVAATKQLGSAFQFKTSIYSSANFENGVLTGDLFVRFSGDPTLTTEQLAAMFNQLKAQGLRQINGQVYLISDSREQTLAPGWVWDDLGICYAAPVSRFIIDKNCAHGRFSPNSNPQNNKGSLSFSSRVPVSVVTDAIFDKTGATSFCELDLVRLGKNHFQLSGCYPGSTAINLAVAINDPQQFAIDTLANVIKTRGIQHQGKIALFDKATPKLILLTEHSSAPLNKLIDTMLLESDNLIADALLKQVGKSYYKDAGQTIGTFSNGTKAMGEILISLGVDLSDARLADGSGLSRYNLLTAHQLVQVLKLIYRDPILSSLIASLPKAGVSGTLKYRTQFTQEPLKNRITAKTGSMQGVANLAGYIRVEATADSPARDYLFVVLENGLTANAKKAQTAPFSALVLQSVIETLR